ncbi:hypothetical protein IIA15_03575 [candidate division TA06 bacterium]|nr:hypothetical protein [candidate division TA06 bacterium]
MNILWITLLSLGGFLFAYRFYGKFLSEKIFSLEPLRKTPAHEFQDGIDYLPTRKGILFGHHFVSICGLGPILGPAIAVIAIGYFALLKIGGRPAGLALWQLFGTSHQLLAGLGLLTVSLFLYKMGKPTLYTLIPMLFMLVTAITAMVIKIQQFWNQKTFPLLVMGTLVLIMALWLGVEAFVSYRAFAKTRRLEALTG